MDAPSWFSQLAYGEWAAAPVAGSRPSARYKHAAAIADEKLYISGGSRNGRFLSDFQVLDLRNLLWSSLNLDPEVNTGKVENDPLPEVIPSSSNHCMVKWGSKLLLLGGDSRNHSDKMTLWFVDLKTQDCGVISASGNVPVARSGFSATVLESRLIIFGGEDKSRRLLNDVFALNLESMTWDVLETTQTPPAPRFDHSAAIHNQRYFLIFGGCSHSVFFSDLHVLDLQTMEWSKPEIQGDLVSPRAGHAGVTDGDKWYIVGGGDNKNGCWDTLVLNMSTLVWSTLTSVKERDPLASEGLTVCSALLDGERYLVAFGGYNGKYNNEVFVMRLKPKGNSLPKIFQSPAAAAAAASVSAAYALAKHAKIDFIKRSESRVAEEDLAIEIETIREVKKALELSLIEVQADNTRIKDKIDENNTTHAELSKELHSVEGQLVAERSRCFKMEAQIAELQKTLESLQAVENEVQLLRRQKAALDKEMEQTEVTDRQGSGGVWRWIAGN